MLLVEARMVTVVNEETGQDEDKFFLDQWVDWNWDGARMKLLSSTEIDAQLYAQLRRLDGYAD